MTTIAATTFKTRFPEFSAETDSRVTLFLDEAEASIDATVWGARWSFGVSYLAAHLLSIASRITAAGVSGSVPTGNVTSESVGGLSKSYGSVGGSTMSAADQILTSTPYGAEYVRLRRSLVITPLVTGSGSSGTYGSW